MEVFTSLLFRDECVNGNFLYKAGKLSFEFIGIYIITKKQNNDNINNSSTNNAPFVSNPIGAFHGPPTPGSASGLGYSGYPGSIIICYFFDSSSCAAFQSWVKYTLQHEPPWTTLLNANRNNNTEDIENDILSLVLPILWFVVYSWADALESVYRQIESLVSKRERKKKRSNKTIHQSLFLTTNRKTKS